MPVHGRRCTRPRPRCWPHHTIASKVGAFITTWQALAPTVPPASVALALQAAGTAVRRQRRVQTVEVVWTGPASGQPLRRTAQVLQGLIDEAQQDLLIIAFAVYDIPEIGIALRRAAQRGIMLRLVIESPHARAGNIAYDSLVALGPQVAAHATIYQWPLAQRPRDNDGRHGSLHVKCAIADGQTLLISSANLTRYALSLNMELGLLLRGGRHPHDVQAHIEALIARGILTQIEALA
ncbi:DISARM system phospholipase D-like protein DrmC [Candidatus Chloroploca asiatica]|uniref:DISARM system phospholipase D-like protein DrmC n=1 Tax=Candidatus Chloroploca asiatica TaxID=1506545 RepID=UPI000BE9CD3F